MYKKIKSLTLTPRAQQYFGDRPTYIEALFSQFREAFMQAVRRQVPTECEVIYEVIINNAHYQVIRKPLADHQTLSVREIEIIRGIVQSQPDKVIAARLNISPWTVAAVIPRIFTKLNVYSRAELIAYAMQNNLLS